MLKALTDTDREVVNTIRMHLNTKQALQYLKDAKVPMSKSAFFRRKKKLEKDKLNRLHYIAGIGFEEQHIARIEKCELAEKLMWKNYYECQDPKDRVQILGEIVKVQPYISSYYDATREVMSGGTSEPTSEGN